MEQQLQHACERTKSKQKQNQARHGPRVILFDLAHKQYNGIIKECFDCLTSGSKGRIFVNNILMFGSAWCLVMTQIQFSLMKKIKIGLTEHLLTPHPLRPMTSNFSLIPHPNPLTVGVICISPLIVVAPVFFLAYRFSFISRIFV